MGMRKVDPEERLRNRTREMMTNDGDWSHLVLPMKKRPVSGRMELGCLLNPVKSDEKVVIVLDNMYNLGRSKSPSQESKKAEYPNVEAAIADGWVVD